MVPGAGSSRKLFHRETRGDPLPDGSRMSGGLTFLAGYTFAKSIDDGSGIRVLGTDLLKPQNGSAGTAIRVRRKSRA